MTNLIDSAKEIAKKFDLTPQEANEFVQNVYISENMNNEQIALALASHAVDALTPTSVKQSFQLLRASMLTLGFEPPKPKGDKTLQDFMNYYAVFGDLLREYDEQVPNRWAKDKFLK